ncbi:DUF6314 family protein [Maliponia aquimaris]|uniref:DUF6314 domain-containing protein n=1 Tax=Maliponia aquimaris TaxID=1673631 RepID=A0A238L702_9RHOB|nr:DUF6314 family protein [Maliponia aquimaris]SMX50864.1 hypothetical protein MAA8898_05066 [Maliponia aquimaris]
MRRIAPHAEAAGTALRLAEFLGRWRIAREIIQDDGTRGTFDGVAVWTPEGDGALYVETGTLSLGGQGRFAAERRYRWGGDLGVFFDDGRFFHQVPPLGGPVGHWCPPDQYDGTYDFGAWPRWQVIWHVRGPRKAYVSTTTYTPDDLISP